jgi:hypothetical protein
MGPSHTQPDPSPHPRHPSASASHHPSQPQSQSQSTNMTTGTLRRNEGTLSPMAPTSSPTDTDNISDSWIEIQSHPSSSSVSSIPQLPTTIPPPISRLATRRQRPTLELPDPPRAISRTSTSSQDEYSESSSESDPILSSSEDLSRPDEEDDDRTALGMRPRDAEAESESILREGVFTPPANAFSHPPSSRRLSSDTNYFNRPSSTPSSAIRDTGGSGRRPHLREHRTSSSYQPVQDHDAALRASLTTLLSCAAAVRPKPTHTSSNENKPTTTERTTTRPSTQPAILSLLPESQIANTSRHHHSPPTTQGHAGTRAVPAAKTTKRRSPSPRSKSKDRKKLRSKSPSPGTAEDYAISPTVAGWLVSAGFILLFSAISFSAGYVWGKEVGRVEGEMSCRSEILRTENIRGGGRVRWGGNSTIRA